MVVKTIYIHRSDRGRYLTIDFDYIKFQLIYYYYYITKNKILELNICKNIKQSKEKSLYIDVGNKYIYLSDDCEKRFGQ